MMGEAKNTKAFYHGQIPNDWEVMTLGEMTTLLTNGFVGKAKEHYVEKEDGVLYIQGYNISDSGFNFNGIKKVSKVFHKKNSKSCLREGDLLTIQTGEIGLTSVVPKELVGANCHALVISRLKRDIANPNFFVQYFNSEIGKRKFKTIETGSTMKHLNVGDMDSLEFPLPPIPEQKAIAQVLSTADSAIRNTEKLIAQKELRKKWLIQQLLTGNKRLKGFSGDVKPKVVENYLKEISERNKDLKITNVLSVTNSRGFINQADQFDRVVASEDATNYKIVRKGQFAYNPSRVNVGSLDLLRDFESGILSPMYVVFETNKSQLLPDYFFYQLKTQWFYGHIPMFIQGSVRDSLSFDGLCSMKFFIPSIEEQTAIAQVLKTADKEISLLKAKAEKFREQKKGLMQKLLTGKIRLKL